MLIAAVDQRWSDGDYRYPSLPVNIFHDRCEERSICAEYPVSLSFDPPIVHSPPLTVLSEAITPDQPSISDVSLPDRSTASPAKVKQKKKKKKPILNLVTNASKVRSNKFFFFKINNSKNHPETLYIFKTLTSMIIIFLRGND